MTAAIADGHHVDRAPSPIITRTKRSERLLLVTDSLSLAGTPGGRVIVGGIAGASPRARSPIWSSWTTSSASGG